MVYQDKLPTLYTQVLVKFSLGMGVICLAMLGHSYLNWSRFTVYRPVDLVGCILDSSSMQGSGSDGRQLQMYSKQVVYLWVASQGALSL